MFRILIKLIVIALLIEFETGAGRKFYINGSKIIFSRDINLRILMIKPKPISVFPEIKNGATIKPQLELKFS